VTNKKGNKCDEKKKAKAVMYYRSCKNTAETARKFGVSRRTIARWIEEYPDIVAVSPEAANAYARAIEDASAIRLAFLREHYDGLSTVIRKAITRAEKLIDKADSLGSVVNAIERLSAVIKDFTPAEDANAGGTTINLLQQTIADQKK
jgi:transposase-like protein